MQAVSTQDRPAVVQAIETLESFRSKVVHGGGALYESFREEDGSSTLVFHVFGPESDKAKSTKQMLDRLGGLKVEGGKK